ncbi:sigma-70 family RNA polymerase sigma factor [Nocardiopsis halotolerans]|uniref:sigma-70 family RNA polymerase sigma factor n=1 Tax=Nocardiopsis halotolerans TaxID=124252 RepID=UPI00034AFF94
MTEYGEREADDTDPDIPNSELAPNPNPSAAPHPAPSADSAPSTTPHPRTTPDPSRDPLSPPEPALSPDSVPSPPGGSFSDASADASFSNASADSPDGNGHSDAQAPSPSDAELVWRATHGERAAWEIIVDRHLPVVNAVARSYHLSAPDREDAVQTVWLTLNQHLPRLHSPERLRAWLRRVTRDVCGRQRRHSARLQPIDPQSLAHRALPETSGPEAEYLRKEEREELHRAIQRLTDPGERRAALRFLNEFAGPPTPSDASRPADGQVHARTAANQRRRMLRRLRRFLEDPT